MKEPQVMLSSICMILLKQGGIVAVSCVFHRQFYVGALRGTNMGRVHVLHSAGSVTKNIVYHNVRLCHL
jgi:hypothetical protein